MIGQRAKSWNSTDNVVVPALLLAIEVSWVSIWIGALAHISPASHIDVPYLSLAIPGACAAAITGWTGLLASSKRMRRAVCLGILLVVTAVAAGALGSIYLHGSFGALVFHPWAQPTSTPHATVTLAWLLCGLVATRGIWLGWSELTLRHVVNSLALTTVAFIVFFFAAEIHRHEVAFHDETRTGVILLLAAFPCAIALVAVVNERDLERGTLRQRYARPSVAWLGAVIVPMTAIALIGALLTLGIGPLIPLVGDVIRAVAQFVVAVISDVVAWIAPHIHLKARLPPATRTGSGTPRPPRDATGGVASWVTVLSATLASLAALTIVLLLARTLRRLLQRRRAKAVVVAAILADERDSVFSWAHLFDQLFSALRRLMRRSAPVLRPPLLERTVEAEEGAGARSIREHYRQVLVAARVIGYGRAPSETPRELNERILGAGEQISTNSLGDLTAIYQRTRYSDEELTEHDIERAGVVAAELVGSWLSPAEVPEPADGE